jgi:hypothetical protein
VAIKVDYTPELARIEASQLSLFNRHHLLVLTVNPGDRAEVFMQYDGSDSMAECLLRCKPLRIGACSGRNRSQENNLVGEGNR